MKQNRQFLSIFVKVLLLACFTTFTEATSASYELDKENSFKNSEHLMEYRNEISGNIEMPTEKNVIEPISHFEPNKFASNCAEATANSQKSGVYTIQVDGFEKGEPFKVFCEADAQGGAWTIIQRRLDGSIDFDRNWSEYKLGFGNLAGEFFIGLAKIHALTTYTSYEQELLIVMEDFDNATRFAKYDSFAIGNEAEGYALKVLGQYSGDAGDSLTKFHASYEFATKDRDNSRGCAIKYTGGWWYGLVHCHESHLNGQYLRGEYSNDKFAQGVTWLSFRGHNYSLKMAKMMIRPRRQ